INQLLNRPIDAPLPKPQEPSLSVFSETAERLEQEYLLKAPMIRSSEAMLQREKLGLDLAKKQYRPDFMTSIEYGNSPNFPDMWEIEVGLRIPIFYKKKQAYGVVEATNNVTRAEKELNSAKQEIAFNIKNEILQIQTSEKLLKLYNDAIIPQSNLTLESSMASYQVGKTEFLTILSNFMTILDYRMNYFEELAKHESAIARLEGAVGRQIANKLPEGGQKND
ncbi:TolC family protein, partial [bacterium]|nr:TolC family protein [bacterium]